MFNEREFSDVVTNSIPLTPLAIEPRSALPTHEAARHLGRKNQTLRLWACHQRGPLHPIRVHGRLMWPTADLRRLLGVDVGGQGDGL